MLILMTSTLIDCIFLLPLLSSGLCIFLLLMWIKCSIGLSCCCREEVGFSAGEASQFGTLNLRAGSKFSGISYVSLNQVEFFTEVNLGGIATVRSYFFLNLFKFSAVMPVSTILELSENICSTHISAPSDYCLIFCFVTSFLNSDLQFFKYLLSLPSMHLFVVSTWILGPLPFFSFPDSPLSMSYLLLDYCSSSQRDFPSHCCGGCWAEL